MTCSGSKQRCCTGLISTLLISMAFAQTANAKNGILLGKYKWDVAISAVEPAANPVVSINGQQLTRKAHPWVKYKASVSFECRLRGHRIVAVNPVIQEDKPRHNPINWGNADGISQLLNIPAVSPAIVPASIRRSDIDVSTGFSRPGCFAIKWKAQFQKSGNKFTYKLKPPTATPVPIQVPKNEISLDENMDDTLLGQTNICCCNWSIQDPPELIKPDDKITGESEPDDSIGADFASELRASTAKDVLKYFGVDWTAQSISSPNPKARGDKHTTWTGTHEVKQCTFNDVMVVVGSNPPQTKRRRNGTFNASNEKLDAIDEKF